jgi:hypothetical protein
MNYPIPQSQRAPFFLAATGLSLLLMPFTGGGLNSQQTPLGIVDLELAGNERRARAVLDAWDAAAQQRAQSAVRLDFLFLLAYSTAISLACLWAAGRLSHRPRLAQAGRVLAWAQWGAALLDAVENLALLMLLQGPVQQPWPALARSCAVPKFAIVSAGLLYALYGWLGGDKLDNG